MLCNTKHYSAETPSGHAHLTNKPCVSGSHESHSVILEAISYLQYRLQYRCVRLFPSICELQFVSALFVCLFAIRAKLKLTHRGKQTNTSVLQSVLQITYFPYCIIVIYNNNIYLHQVLCPPKFTKKISKISKLCIFYIFWAVMTKLSPDMAPK